jgi:hypothetical protein
MWPVILAERMNITKESVLSAKPVWLRLDSSHFSFQKTETLEYSLSATLVSASLNISFEFNADNILTASGQGSLRILFKKAQSASAFSEGSLKEEGSAFANYIELDQAGQTLNQWNMALDKTTREWPAKGDLPAAVLNPLLVLPAFISSWQPETPAYFGQIVAGKRTHAIKIELAKVQTKENLLVYKLSAKKTAAPVVKDQWSEIVWGDSDLLEFHFDTKEKVIRTFRYRISPFGSLTASLKGLERG